MDVPAALRKRLKQTVRFRGAAFLLLEVLDEPAPVLVLQRLGHTVVQADQFGEAHRRAPDLLEVPIYLEGGAVNPEIDEILAAT